MRKTRWRLEASPHGCFPVGTSPTLVDARTSKGALCASLSPRQTHQARRQAHGQMRHGRLLARVPFQGTRSGQKNVPEPSGDAGVYVLR